MKLICIGLLLAYCSRSMYGHGISGQLYSSLTHMNDLFVFDSKVVDILAYLPTYLPETQKYMDSHSSLATDIALLGGGDLLSVSITGNPLHIYTVIKRLVLYWPSINRAMAIINDTDYTCGDKDSSCKWWAQWSECEKNPVFMMVNCQLSCGLCGKEGVQDKITSLRELESHTVLPSGNDLRGAAVALARLQQVYRLPIPDLAGGLIASVSTSVRLSTYDCLRIANESHFEGEFANSWQWYNFALGSTTDADLRGHIQALMFFVRSQHDQYHQSFVPQFFPYNLSDYEIQAPWDTRYSQLCRGLKLLDDEFLSQFKCYISPLGSPYLKLQPVKYEHLHNDPEMYMFYDVISANEIQAIKDTAKENLYRSMVVSSESPVELRVSHTAWLQNDSHPVLPKIAQRISAITGLHVFEGPLEDMAGELLQVLSYGIGGHYTYHHDPLFKTEPEDQWYEVGSKYDHYPSGDRVATWMFYLSSVEAGGRTAFPQAGISVPPIEGAAVYWYSIKKNGYGNQKSEHGGCPVLLGHKWVANKWIRENINFLRRPCSLNPDE